MARPPLPPLSDKVSVSVRNLEIQLWEAQVGLREAGIEIRKLKVELDYARSASKQLGRELAELKTKE
jgi:hypothetical protein